MTSQKLRIVYGDQPSQRANVLTETLRSQGHEVVAPDDKNGFLSGTEPDLYLLARTLGDGTSGLELLADLRRAGRSAPVLLIDERPSFDDMRQAIELGATDIVLHPLESGVLAGAIARALASRRPRPRISDEPVSHSCQLSYVIDESTVGRSAREVSAFLVNEGVVNAHRVRIASAVAELVDNACRHAYPKASGQVSVHIAVQGARVQLSVEDQGRGFDAARARLERIPAALPVARGTTKTSTSNKGLGRVERLCEGHAIVSGTSGTRVELTFELSPVRFDEESEHLAETDFLDPTRARTLIASLRKGHADLSGMAPGMALTIGRILGGLDAEIRPPTRKNQK